MRNRYLERFDSTVKVVISGSNVMGFLKRVMKGNIKLRRIVPISRGKVEVVLGYDEYLKLLEYRSIYEVRVISVNGSKRGIDIVRKNFILIICIFMGMGLVIFLSRCVSEVEVIHQDKDIRNMVKQELERYGVKKYALKKSYFELEEIENKIIEDNKDIYEWIEIISYGTKYMVRVEERKVTDSKSEFKYQHIVSRKNAVISRVDAVSGEKRKVVNDYVSKGDVVIAGEITLPDNSYVLTMAKGSVYGEVWYQVKIDYPYVYQESNLTGKSRDVLAIYFFGKRYGLFDFKRYRSFDTRVKVLFSFNMLDIKFVKERQYEAVVRDEIYTDELVDERAISYVKEKMMRDNIYIKDISEVKVIERNSDEEGVSLRLFVKAIEDIGEVLEIREDGS